MSTQSGETKLTLTNKIGWAFALSLVGVILLGSVIGPVVKPLPNPAAKSPVVAQESATAAQADIAINDEQEEAAKALLRAFIQDRGYSCSYVTKVLPLGTTTSGDPLLLAACRSGERWIVQFDRQNHVKGVADCLWVKETSGAAIDCWAL